jgi:hypothetical protein
MSRSITPRLSQNRSESTPHDAVTVDQRSQRHPSFLLALRRQRSSSQRFDGFTSSRFTNLVVQRAARSFTPTRPSMLCHKPIAATAPVRAPHPSSRRQFPIAHAAPPLHRRPRFPALALLGRWLPQRADGLHIPASENLHKRRQDCRSGLGLLHRLKQTWFCEAGGPSSVADIFGINSLAIQYRAFPGVRGNGIASRTLARPVT